jgi:glycosyltransferase involved in cell wall biosynthesis
MTIAEAFACGLPVICGRLGSMQELVSDHHTGLHFTAGDADDLADKVEWAWTHPDEIAGMGHAARAEFEAHYCAKRNYEMLVEIYEKVMNTGGVQHLDNERPAVALPA